MADISTPGPGPEDSKLLGATPAVSALQTSFDKFLTAANVEAVYGPPVEQGENLVIPAAEILSVAGFGLGSGTQGAAEAENADSSGVGGGGGGRVFARPVAVIIMSPAGVRVEPIVDVTKIALAAFTTLGFMATMIVRMTRRRPKLGD
jgi:uncharacterized spore protein YtfJ